MLIIYLVLLGDNSTFVYFLIILPFLPLLIIIPCSFCWSSQPPAFPVQLRALLVPDIWVWDWAFSLNFLFDFTLFVIGLSLFIDFFVWFHIVCDRYTLDNAQLTYFNPIWPLSLSSNFGTAFITLPHSLSYTGCFFSVGLP